MKVCYPGALQIAGRWYSVDELMRILNRDRQYWGRCGGASFTGGEPLLQHHFLAAVLARCREAGIPTAVETACHIDTVVLREMLPLVDWVFADIKHMDPVQHREAIGVDNALILSNIRMIAASGWRGRLIIRVPVVPGFNDSPENAEATARFVNDAGLEEINLLPFHRLGTPKYEHLGVLYRFADQPAPSTAVMAALVRVYEAAGLKCYLGPDTPF